MKSTIVKVNLTPDDMLKIQRLIDKLPDVKTPEEALVWLLRKHAASVRPSSGGIFTTKGISWDPAPEMRERPDPFETPGIPWERSNELRDDSDPSRDEGPSGIGGPF